MVDALDSHVNKVSTDCEEQHFQVPHTSFGARGERKKLCSVRDVSSVAEDLRAASPVSPVFSLS